jgi:hypothetical protein
MDRVFSLGTVDNFIAQANDRRQAFIGVFDNELIAVVIVVMVGTGIFNGHLCTAPKADVTVIASAAESILYDLLDYNLRYAYCWVAERNISVRRLCSTIGFQPDGAVMYKGRYPNRLIKWVRHSIQREQLLTAIAA